MSSPYQFLPFTFDYKLKRVGAHALEKSVVVAISQSPLVSLMVDQVSSLQMLWVVSKQGSTEALPCQRKGDL